MKHFWKELIAYLPFIDMDYIENDAFNNSSFACLLLLQLQYRFYLAVT
jgi:hypothetical protein